MQVLGAAVLSRRRQASRGIHEGVRVHRRGHGHRWVHVDDVHHGHWSPKTLCKSLSPGGVKRPADASASDGRLEELSLQPAGG
jgi:hypothetical protein